MPRVLALCGSPLPDSRAHALTRHVAKRLEEAGFEIDTLDIRDLPAEDYFLARFDSPAVKEASERVAKADGIVIVSPVYKASFTGALKLFLDLLPQYGLTGKTVLPLMIGGSAAHLLAIDTALRPVLCSMAPWHVTQGVYFTDAQLPRDADGNISIDPAVAPRLDAAVADFLMSAGLRPSTSSVTGAAPQPKI